MNPLHLRNKLKSINNLYHMVHSMETLATMKISKLKYALEARKKYTLQIETLLNQLLLSFPEHFNQFSILQPRVNETKPLYIVLSSDRGFCGAMKNIIEGEAKKTLSKKQAYQCWVFGKKTAQWLKEDGFKVSRIYELSLEKVEESFVGSFIDEILNDLRIGNIDVVYFISMAFYSSLSQKIKTRKIIPLDPIQRNIDANQQDETQNTLLLPDAVSLIDTISSLYLKAVILRIFIEAAASEQAMRMMSMKNASDSAKEMLETVRQDYQHMRQEKITRELMELVLYESSTKNKRR